MKIVSVYLFIDALGWEIVQNNNFCKSDLPFRYPVKMQFGYSSTAIPTILSGEYPNKHNHFSFFYYDPINSPFKAFKFVKYFFGAGLHPNCLLNRGRVRGYLSKLFAWIKGYTGYFQLYQVPYEKLPYLNYCEKKDIFAKKGLSPLKNLKDFLGESGIRFLISDWRKPESYNLAEAEKALLNREVDFAFIYTAQLDAFLHDNVLNPKAVSERLSLYEARLKSFFKRLKEKEISIKFTIISDHGMTPLKGTVDLMKRIDELELKFAKDYVAVYDSTMARFWYLDSKAKEKIRNRLSNPDCRGTFLTEEEKAHYGINFAAQKFGEDIFLMHTGVQIAPCDLGQKPLNGMHGFSPEDKDSYACFLSTHAPNFIPKEIKDFFHLMKNDINSLKLNFYDF
jgi:predicted AlkP superfamily pyrophosphatase or phosphodiesterase